MTIRGALLVVLTCSIVVRSAAGQYGDAAVEATDLLKLRQIGDVRVSPDGRQIVYTVRSIEEVEGTGPDRDSLVYRTHLFLADAGGWSDPRQLTRGEQGASEPSWHPDGNRIAFVRETEDGRQVFVLPLLGGEAYQVTNLEHGASAPRWSPDGARLLVASALSEDALRERLGQPPPWPLERPGISWADLPEDTDGDPDGSLTQIRAWLDRNAGEKNPRVIHRLDLQGERRLEPAPTYRHLFVVEVDTTTEPTMITHGYASFDGAVWLPDGQSVVAGGRMYADDHPDRTHDSHLYVVRADGGGATLLLDLPEHAISAPAVSPDGKHLAFAARDTSDRGYAQTELGVLAIDDPAGFRLVTDSLDRSISNLTWSPDGWYLYFTAESNGGIPLYRLRPFQVDTSASDLTGPATDEAAPESEDTAAAPEATDPSTSEAESVSDDDPAAAAEPVDTTRSSRESAGRPVPIERLTSFERGVQSFGVGRATVFFAATDVANPYELYAANLAFSEERRLTSHNAEWLETKRISFPERRVLTRDSLQVEYWVMKPAFFDSTRTYPLLVEIHGGPMAMWGPGEATMWHELQYFASRDYAIVFSNPRGSGGYGYDFQRASYRDWSDGPGGDVLAAADEAAALAWTDTTRQVVTGGSYGGYLTAWIAAHDHRFRAAVAQRGVYDLSTFLGEGNAWRLVPTHFGTYPWERPSELPAPLDTTRTDSLSAALQTADVLARSSPLTYVDRIRTPLLIVHADDDLRTGVAQSEMLYKSLKILGRPVEYVRYPNAGHDLSRSGDPRQRLDRLLRIYEFFERFIR